MLRGPPRPSPGAVQVPARVAGTGQASPTSLAGALPSLLTTELGVRHASVHAGVTLQLPPTASRAGVGERPRRSLEASPGPVYVPKTGGLCFSTTLRTLLSLGGCDTTRTQSPPPQGLASQEASWQASHA